MKPCLVLVIACLLQAASPAQAQIRTDASLGQAAQTLSGPNYQILQSLGTVSGANLFHSFQTFSLAAGEIANFTTTSAGIRNVISRVTGGSASQINGTLRLTAASGSTPAFFFINPAGVTFGAGASVDVPGAFHVSTANSLKFADGRFDTDLGNASTLSSAQPEAFGFLGATRATVAVREGVILKPKTNHPISVMAGDVELDAGGVGAAAGDVRVVAVGGIAADMGLEKSAQDTTPELNGNLSIVNQGYLLASNRGADPAGTVTVRAGHVLLASGGNISSFTESMRDAGDVMVRANRISLDSEGYIYSSATANQTMAVGRGAGISLAAADAIVIKGGASVSSDTRAAGDAGRIGLQARSIAMSDGAYVASDTYAKSTGNTGSIALSATDEIVLTQKSKVYVSTEASGGASPVVFQANDIALASGAYVSSIALEGSANAGTVELAAQRSLTMADDASLSSVSQSTGNASAVRVSATDITLDTRSKIFSTAVNGTSSGGPVDVVASKNLLIRNGSMVVSSTFSSGHAGTVKIAGFSTTLDNDSTISSLAGAGSGHSGPIEVIGTERLTVSRNAGIVSNTFAQGNAGAVLIAGKDLVFETGGYVATASLGSGLNGPGEVGGHGGNIRIAATGAVTLASASLSSGSATAGRAGAIDVAARSLTMDSSRIATSTLQSDGGNIAMQVAGLVQLRQSAVTTTADGGTGNGGNIDISADAMVMKSGSILARTQASNAMGGRITLNLQTLAASANTLLVGGDHWYEPDIFGFNVITASAPLGVSGEVRITSPVLDLSGSLMRLNAQLVEPTPLGRTLCQTKGGSSLVQVGRAGLTVAKVGVVGAPLALFVGNCS